MSPRDDTIVLHIQKTQSTKPQFLFEYCCRLIDVLHYRATRLHAAEKKRHALSIEPAF
jgi:hypothetical protein